MSFVLDGVQYTYPEGRRPILSGLGLEIPSGSTTAILGLSGAGKSTLLYLLGLLWEGRLDSGSITFRDQGRDYAYDRLSPLERSGLRASRFGFALQSSYLLPHFSCEENIVLPLAMAGWSPQQWRPIVDDLIRRADSELSNRKGTGDGEADRDDERGLSEARDNLPAQVSGGQRQRVSVLRSIVHDPQVVFADEPFSSLDALNTGLILDLLRDWRLGALPHSRPDVGPRTLLLVCHDLEVAYNHADFFVFLSPARRGPGGGRNRAEVIPRDRLPGGPDDLRARIEEEPRA